MQDLPAGLNLVGREAQLLLYLINDAAPARVDADMLEGLGEGGDVGLDGSLEHLLGKLCVSLHAENEAHAHKPSALAIKRYKRFEACLACLKDCLQAQRCLLE